ncbi:hypothetical protein WK72_09425 [Burkholderia ubonensis]|nr:hypothetical protein WK72_09425 [Burkholderia ubonensis]KWB60809.1 hypothetical protein WL38_26290 [Burkholderia ubonensis]KWB64212.1 hypothetical protein WL39_14655 [Burkholderia ubonensis]KWH04122.1 hypothetical protein WL97_27630 [Burkholderia ubonensis]OJA80889.1 hypothetical protein BGV72_02865 [Burkholderia ubonensis]
MPPIALKKVGLSIRAESKTHSLTKKLEHSFQLIQLKSSEVFWLDDAKHRILDVVNSIHFYNLWIDSNDDIG